MTVGSSSAIFACGAARLGLRVAFVGVVGDDAFGRFMLDAMAGRGIDVSACTVDPARADRGHRDPHERPRPGDADRDGLDRRVRRRRRAGGAARAGAPRPFGRLLPPGASRDRLPAFFAAARARGLTTSFDTNWDPTEQWDGGVREMLRAADLFFPNAAEATRIAGVEDPELAATALASTGAEGRLDGGPIVVVKHGPAGAVVAQAGEAPVRVAAMPVEPVDTTGAGDSFNAGFLRAWLDGGTLADCLELGAVVRRAVDARGRRGRRPADVRRGDGGARGLAGERMTATDPLRRREPVDRPAVRAGAADGRGDPSAGAASSRCPAARA